jgi:2,6-dihydroxypyridine 3-monooxygenase
LVGESAAAVEINAAARRCVPAQIALPRAVWSNQAARARAQTRPIPEQEPVPDSSPTVIVIGGSLGGLMAALALRDAGCAVDVFDRVPGRLEGQGAGLRVVPELATLLRERVGITLDDVSTFVPRYRVVGADDRILAEHDAPAHFASWGSIHGALAQRFGAARYHLGETCTGLSIAADSVEVRFADGSVRGADLVVFADGILSTGRRLLAPETGLDYAGYVAWRGYVPEADMSAAAMRVLADALIYCVVDRSHIGFYPIPHPILRDPKRRFLNYVWYRNASAGPELDRLLTDRGGTLRQVTLPAGAVQQSHIDAMKAAARGLFPPSIVELIEKTEAPFMQAIYDVRVPRMAYGRACLVGDAAFVARPHAGASVGKAAMNAWRLADHVRAANHDIPAALAAWEGDELALGNAFVVRNRAIGHASLVEGRYDPADPAYRPGLFSPNL